MELFVRSVGFNKKAAAFLLKEAYDGTSDWSLVCDHLLLKDKKMSHLWTNVCRWTDGLMNTTSTEIPKFQLRCI